MLKGGLNARLNALGVAPPKIEKGPKSAPKFFSDSFQFLAELRVLQPPLCIKKPLCEAVLRVLAGSCTQKSTPFHIFSFFMKTHIVYVEHKSGLKFTVQNADSTLEKTRTQASAFVYFVSGGISGGTITVRTHDNSYGIPSLGLKTLKSLCKYQVDVLGNVFPVHKETRQKFR